jgi:hypothetical protein
MIVDAGGAVVDSPAFRVGPFDGPEFSTPVEKPVEILGFSAVRRCKPAYLQEFRQGESPRSATVQRPFMDGCGKTGAERAFVKAKVQE